MKQFIDYFIPYAATEAARSWDMLFWFLFIVCVVFFIIVMVPAVFFMIRYRRKAGRKTDPIAHNDILEVAWTAIPTVVLMVIFAWGWIVYKDLQYKAPRDSVQIKVVAKKWQWAFQYPDGKIINHRLYVQQDEPVQLTITSELNDVLHSFFVPAFRIKKDAVPGLYNKAWFQADTVGRYLVFCTEYCGTQHSVMAAQVIVLDEERYKLWQWGKLKEEDLPDWIGPKLPAAYNRDTPLPSRVAKKSGESKFAEARPIDRAQQIKLASNKLIEQGRKLSRTKGCVACHSTDGRVLVGPSYKGLYHTEVALMDGSRAVVDEAYIRESILWPQAKKRKGFERKVMPPYPGQLSELELDALIAYIRSVQ